MLEQVKLACGCTIGMSQHRIRKAQQKGNVGSCGKHGQQKIERIGYGTTRRRPE